MGRPGRGVPSCQCLKCKQLLGRPCCDRADYDPATRLWLCNRCWGHIDPGIRPRTNRSKAE